MKTKTYLVAIIAFVLLLAIPGLVSADYSDTITDDEDDVFYWQETEDGFRWKSEVERPDIDIIRVSIEEIDGNISVELEVKGTIQEDVEVWYYIALEDEDGNSYDIYKGHGYPGECYLDYPGGGEALEPSGFGTSTFQVSFSLELVGNPESLEISEVITHDWLDSEDEGEYYHDTAGPEATEPDTEDDEGEIDPEGILEDIFARGLICLAVVVLIPLIILVIIVVVVIKMLSSDDEGGQQPPQQGSSTQQQQQPPPPEDQGGSGETPPPPGNE